MKYTKCIKPKFLLLLDQNWYFGCFYIVQNHPPSLSLSYQLSPFTLHVLVKICTFDLEWKKTIKNRQPNDIFYDNYFLNEQNTLNVYWIYMHAEKTCKNLTILKSVKVKWFNNKKIDEIIMQFLPNNLIWPFEDFGRWINTCAASPMTVNLLV